MTHCSTAKIIENEELRGGCYTMKLDAPHVAAGCTPGQFILLRGLRRDWPYLRRPFSVYSSDGESAIEIIYKVVGRATSIMSRMGPGEEFDVVGPLGRGFTPKEACAHTVAVAGGIGLPPIAYYCRKYADLSDRITLIIGAPTRDELLLPVGLVVQGVEVATYTEDGSKGLRGTALDGLAAVVEAPSFEPSSTQVVACGPREMLALAAGLCREHGVECQVCVEETMACGVGACLSCAVPSVRGGYLHVCKDGPVFSGDQLDWTRWLDT